MLDLGRLNYYFKKLWFIDAVIKYHNAFNFCAGCNQAFRHKGTQKKKNAYYWIANFFLEFPLRPTLLFLSLKVSKRIIDQLAPRMQSNMKTFSRTLNIIIRQTEKNLKTLRYYLNK